METAINLAGSIALAWVALYGITKRDYSKTKMPWELLFINCIIAAMVIQSLFYFIKAVT